MAIMLSVAMAATVQQARSATIFVSPKGSDSAPGTIAKPFLTLARAQEAARRVAGKQPVTIYLRQGIYYLPQPLLFTSADSGTKEAPVTYSAYKNEEVRISGGQKLTLTWQPCRDGIMMAKVPDDCDTDQLFVNGLRQILARYPNYNPSQRILQGYSADAFSADRAKRWSDPVGGYIHAMQSAEWGDLWYEITGKDATGNITYVGGWQNNRQMGMHPEQRYVENIFEELDAPNEWFLNKKTHALYYYPPVGLNLQSADVETARLTSLVEFRGDDEHPVRFVRFNGITFERTARTFMQNKEPILRSDWTIYQGRDSLFLWHRKLLRRKLQPRPSRRKCHFRQQLQPSSDHTKLLHSRCGRKWNRFCRRSESSAESAVRIWSAPESQRY